MMIATESVVVKKLKIKFSGRRVEAEPHSRSCGFKHSGSLADDWTSGAVKEKERHETVKKRKYETASESHSFAADGSNLRISVSGANKRGPQVESDVPKKRQRMDRVITQQCSAILKKLMQHQCGWPFNQPVDPVALNIPDYFSIITKPMDLRTVKSKLEKNMYAGTEEFAADIRLTFSNAMRYNPPGNLVHQMADKLNKVFEVGWKVLEAKWSNGNMEEGQGAALSRQSKEGCAVRQNDPKTPPLCTNLPQNRLSSVEKFKKGHDTVVAKVTAFKVAKNCTLKSLQNNQKGIGTAGASGHACPSKCDACGSITCQCNPSGPTLTSSTETSSGCGQNNMVDTLRPARSASVAHSSKSDQDSDGPVSEGNVLPCSGLATPVSDATCGEGWNAPTLDVQLSPKKALRAAMLRSRFADTILKAQQKTLLDHGDKADHVKLHQEKERLEKRQREEKAKIEAQIRATEVAQRMRVEAELKKQRDREREAARIALQKMERTVDFEENLAILKELEMLSGCSSSPYLADCEDGSEVSVAFDGARGRSPLERLGLFIKNDFLEDDEEAVLNGEEGEILS